MQTIKIQSSRISSKEVGIISDFLKRGKVMVYPTDTIYGLGCLATKRQAINKIFRVKKKDKKKSLLVLVGSVAMAKKYCLINSRQGKILKKVWPGPVTVIMNTKKSLPKELTGGSYEAGLGVRLPDNVFLRKIIKKVGVPLVSTSANKSGQEPIVEVEDIKKYFKKNKPDLVVDGGVLRGRPSKLIDLRDIDNIKILR